MRITLLDAAIGTGTAAALPATSLMLDEGQVSVVVTSGMVRPVYLSLVIAGRMKPTSGVVLIDGVDDARQLRTRVAVVDAPGIAEPPARVSLRRAIASELTFTGRRSRRRDVEGVLERYELLDRAGDPVESLEPERRIALLTDLAAWRPGVEALIVVAPHRHGGDPADWLPALRAHAERGATVAVLTDSPTAEELLSIGAVAPTLERTP